MLTHINRRASPSPPTLYDGTEISAVDSTNDLGVTVNLDFPKFSSLSTSSKSRPAYPVSASSWFCSLDTRDIPTTVSGSCEANSGVWPAGVFALPTTRHRPDGAHTAPSHTYGQRHERVAIRGQASLTEFISLERRRLRGELILAYNILHGRLDLPQAEFF